MKPAKTAKEQGKKGRFGKGTSGNPAGRPQGSRNRATIAVDALLDGHAEKLTATCITAALAGDSVAMRLCLERICPPRRYKPIAISIPDSQINSVADLLRIQRAVLSQVFSRAISPEEGQALMGLLEQHSKMVETMELVQKIERLEAEQLGKTDSAGREE